MPMPKKPRPACKNCGKPVDRSYNIYCRNQCQQDFQHKEWIREWLAGNKDGLKGGVETSDHIRRYLKERYGECCVICGWAEENPSTGLIPLHLHHIDGNWANNRPENVCLICTNHHALTSTYGATNRGNGRPFGVHKKIK